MAKRKRKNNNYKNQQNSPKTAKEKREKIQLQLINNLKQLSRKELIKLVSVFLASMVIFAIPFLFVEVKNNIYMYFIPVILTSVFVSFRFTGIFNGISEFEKNLISYLILIAVPIVNALFIAPSNTLEYFLVNLCIIGIIYFPLFFIFRNSVIPVTSVSVLCFLLNTTNDVLIVTRGTVFTLSDIVALKTALTVASNYSYHLTQTVYFSFISLVSVIIWAFMFPYKPKSVANKIARITGYIIPAILSLCFIFTLADEIAEYSDNPTFDNIYETNDRGICYNLTMNIKESFLAPPEGYSKQAAEEILSRYTIEENDNHPNVIIVMNESFADLSVYDVKINPSEDYMPFIRSLNENVTKGYALPPTSGGGTANSEFEYLTGLSMGLLPNGKYPYLQYINGDTKTIASDLDPNIYNNKIYIHPYIASNYRRSSIFQFLGFDKFYDGLSFSEQEHYTERIDNITGTIEYEGVELIRGYIGDGVTYDKAIELYEAKPEGSKTFQFIVTMQNHAPYHYEGDDFETTITSGTEHKEIDQYLSLIKTSDEEIRKLIEYFSQEDEDTVIVFFGDHTPNLWLQLIEHNDSLGYIPDYNAFNNSLTPFFIWTNFDSETEDVGYVSLNYLSLLTKKKAGIELTQFDMFREEMYRKYPVFARGAIIDSEGNIYHDKNELDDDLISEYEILQYYYLFDQ